MHLTKGRRIGWATFSVSSAFGEMVGDWFVGCRTLDTICFVCCELRRCCDYVRHWWVKMIVDKLLRAQQDAWVAQYVRRKTGAGDVPRSTFTDVRHFYAILSPPPLSPSPVNVHHQRYALRLNFSVNVEIKADVPPPPIFRKSGRCSF